MHVPVGAPQGCNRGAEEDFPVRGYHNEVLTVAAGTELTVKQQCAAYLVIYTGPPPDCTILQFCNLARQTIPSMRLRAMNGRDSLAPVTISSHLRIIKLTPIV